LAQLCIYLEYMMNSFHYVLVAIYFISSKELHNFVFLLISNMAK